MKVTLATTYSSPGAESTLLLRELATRITRDCDTEVQEETVAMSGKKADLITALTFSLVTIQTLVSVLTYLHTTEPTYSITVRRGSADLTIGNLSYEDAVEILNSEDSQEVSVSIDKE